jgi:hypothetical protein
VKPTVFIQANERQHLGAKISAHSYRRNASDADSFDVRILHTRDVPRLGDAGQTYLRGGKITPWDPNDLQSFTPLRFFPPQAMGFEGVAVVTDPDVFAVGDVGELFARDREGKAILGVERPGDKRRPFYVASSVMLLDCSKLKHWRFDEQLDGLFGHEFDYFDWVHLGLEEAETIGLLEPEWNDFDRMTARTKLLHTTKRRTQPWKTGLPVDFTVKVRTPAQAIGRLWPWYRKHPDRNQEAFVFSLLAELVDSGEVTSDELEREMAANHIRHDAPQLIDRYRGWDLRLALAA